MKDVCSTNERMQNVLRENTIGGTGEIINTKTEGNKNSELRGEMKAGQSVLKKK